MLLVLALFSFVPIYLVKDVYFARMATLPNYEEEGSAASRIRYAKAAFEMWKDYPLLGVGFGGRNYSARTGEYLGWKSVHGVHNSYLQMLVDSGIFAFLLYVGLLFGSIAWLGFSAARTRREHPGLECIPIAIQVALITFSVGGTFGSAQRYDFSYFLFMCGASWYIVVHRLREEAMRSASPDGVVPPSEGPARSVAQPVAALVGYARR
jgi:O-antigen ligase